MGSLVLGWRAVFMARSIIIRSRWSKRFNSCRWRKVGDHVNMIMESFTEKWAVGEYWEYWWLPGEARITNGYQWLASRNIACFAKITSVNYKWNWFLHSSISVKATIPSLTLTFLIVIHYISTLHYHWYSLPYIGFIILQKNKLSLNVIQRSKYEHFYALILPLSP